MQRNFAIILAGCGYQDGSEIHEATMSMLAIKNAGHDYRCFAPNKKQQLVTNHISGETMQEERNVLVESARIARGQVSDLKELKMADFDALILPGGFGAAQNLCTFAKDGPDCNVDPDIERIIKEAVHEQKPIGALCISPVILAKIMDSVTVTIGDSDDVNAAIKCMGGHTKNTGQTEVVIDHEHKVVTGPCYMLDSNIVEISQGAKNVVDAVIQLIS